jgi:hypothetical protein
MPCSDELKTCVECDGNTKACSACSYGYSPDAATGKCMDCSKTEGCVECSSPTECTSCQSGFGLDPDTGACVEVSTSLLHACVVVFLQ